MNSSRYLGLLLILMCISTFSQNLTRVEYIQKYKDIAIRKMKTHGIPASITLAQGALESGNGNSYLAVEGNNHFGIKCHNGWKGKTIKHDDDKRNECFRKYDDVEDSYNDHSEFLTSGSRYAFLFDLEQTDYRGWAHGLKKAGYATNPQYAQLLIKIIEDNALYKYDSGKEVIFDPNHTPYRLKKLSPLIKIAKSRNIFVTNRVPYIISKEGDTYKKIAREAKLFHKEILFYNDLVKSVPLKPGTKVYLDFKRRRAPRSNKVHTIEEGDTYYSISQKYGIQIKLLYKHNEVEGGVIAPKVGVKLKLR